MWVAEFDTNGRELPTCVHVTKTTNTMTHGSTYVPIEEGRAVRDENAKLRELVRKLYGGYMGGHYMISCRGCEHAYEDCGGYVPLDSDYCVFSDSDRYVGCWKQKRLEAEMRELGVEVDG